MTPLLYLLAAAVLSLAVAACAVARTWTEVALIVSGVLLLGVLLIPRWREPDAWQVRTRDAVTGECVVVSADADGRARMYRDQFGCRARVE